MIPFATAVGISLTGSTVMAAGQSPVQEVAVPISDTQIEHALGKLDGLAQGVLERSGIPGMAVAVTWKGKTVFAKGFGVREAGNLRKVDADTVFQIASVSKSIAGTVVAGTMGEGAVSWKDPITRYLPDFRLSDPTVTSLVTLGDLFSHRSGLPDHAGDDLEDLGFDRTEILDRLQLLPLGPFRLQYAYTNFGLTAAAEAVASAAGADWATLAEDVLYKPLGMSRTSSRFDDYLTRKNRAVPHVGDNGSFESLYQRMPDAQSPAGGVSSSVNDLAKWMALVLDDGQYKGIQVIEKEALLAAASGQMLVGPSRELDARPGLYGFGFNVSIDSTGRIVIGHSGAFALGAATNFLLVPSLDLGIVVLTNAEPFGVPESLTRLFVDSVEFGKPTRDWLNAYKGLFAPMAEPVGRSAGKARPSNPKPARKLADYQGVYTSAYFGPLTVGTSADDLTVTIGPAKVRQTLTHWDGDMFVLDLRTENAPFGSRSLVRFDMEYDQQPKSVWVEVLDENGFGTFEKQ